MGIGLFKVVVKGGCGSREWKVEGGYFGGERI